MSDLDQVDAVLCGGPMSGREIAVSSRAKSIQFPTPNPKLAKVRSIFDDDPNFRSAWDADRQRFVNYERDVATGEWLEIVPFLAIVYRATDRVNEDGRRIMNYVEATQAAS